MGEQLLGLGDISAIECTFPMIRRDALRVRIIFYAGILYTTDIVICRSFFTSVWFGIMCNIFLTVRSTIH